MKILTFVLISLITTPCFGNPPPNLYVSMDATPSISAGDVIYAYNSADTTPTEWLINQNAEGTGYDNSETWSESGTVDEDYTTTELYTDLIETQIGTISHSYGIIIPNLFKQNCKQIGWNKKTGKLTCEAYSEPIIVPKPILDNGGNKMFNFLFGWLGSLIFWAAFLTAGFFIGTMMLKRIAPRTFRFITTGNMNSNLAWFEVVVIIIGLYLFWPIVGTAILLGLAVKFIFSNMIWGTFCKAVKAVNKNMPTISFDKNTEEDA